MTLPTNYYRSTKEKPYHLSVGIVVVNEAEEFLVRHFSTFHGEKVDLCLFPTETIEQDETLEETVHRGLREEVGAEAEIISFIGSIHGLATMNNKTFEKTVIYFLCRFKKGNSPLYPDEDGESITEWHPAKFLIDHQAQQPPDIQNSILNETKIIEAAVEVLKYHHEIIER